MIFDILIPNLIPLYLLIALGYISGRWLDVNLHSVARLNLFIFLPIVSLGAMIRIEFNPTYIILPLTMMGISYAISLSAYTLSKHFWKDGTANLMGAAGVNGNAIYFGLPLIIAMFGPEGAGIYLFLNLGPQINNMTLAYYLVARGQFSVKQSLFKVLLFPVIHAIWIGLLLNFFGVHMSGVFQKYWEYASGCNIFLGMMMIGIGIAKIPKLTFDYKQIFAFFLIKFVLWPAAVLTFVILDIQLLHLFDSKVHQILIFFSVMPLIGNLVAYAAEYNLHPEKTAAAVLMSSVATIIIVPAAYIIILWLSIA